MVIDNNVSLLVFVAVGVVIPFLVDLVTKKLASGALKQTSLLALSLVSSLLVEFGKVIAAGGVFDWQTAGYGAITTFIIGVGVYTGLSRTPVLGRDSVISNLIPGGLGKTQPIKEIPGFNPNQ